MKRNKTMIPFVLLVMFLLSVTSQAQEAPQVFVVPLVTQQPGGPPLVDILNVLQGFQTRGGLAGRGAGGNATGAGGPVIPNRPNAWWLNDDVTAQLGLTEDQKLRVERAFENRREEIVSS